MNIDKKWTILDHLPTPLVNVVCEQAGNIWVKDIAKVDPGGTFTMLKIAEIVAKFGILLMLIRLESLRFMISRI